MQIARIRELRAQLSRLALARFSLCANVMAYALGRGVNASWRRARQRGAVSVEYVVLLGTCGLVISLAIVSLGPAIAAAYQQNRQIVIAPVP